MLGQVKLLMTGLHSIFFLSSLALLITVTLKRSEKSWQKSLLFVPQKSAAPNGVSVNFERSKGHFLNQESSTKTSLRKRLTVFWHGEARYCHQSDSEPDPGEPDRHRYCQTAKTSGLLHDMPRSDMLPVFGACSCACKIFSFPCLLECRLVAGAKNTHRAT